MAKKIGPCPSDRDDFLPDNATDSAGRRRELNNALTTWAGLDIAEILRCTENGQEGWAMWTRA